MTKASTEGNRGEVGGLATLLQRFKPSHNQVDELYPKKYRLEIEAMRFCNCYTRDSFHATGCRIWEHKL